LSTAGGEGMLNLLPIFADHVLFATLTEEGFVTEVHCVNGSGEDKGVVYCEMQVSFVVVWKFSVVYSAVV
jgi:Zn-dependent M16 (insulinase) family peptidase